MSGATIATTPFVGQQSILWDVAGTILEWRMIVDQIRTCLAALKAKGVHVGEEDLRFYLAAYAGFKLGLMSLGPAAEEAAFYTEQVQQWLAQPRERPRYSCSSL